MITEQFKMMHLLVIDIMEMNWMQKPNQNTSHNTLYKVLPKYSS